MRACIGCAGPRAEGCAAGAPKEMLECEGWELRTVDAISSVRLGARGGETLRCCAVDGRDGGAAELSFASENARR